MGRAGPGEGRRDSTLDPGSISNQSSHDSGMKPVGWRGGSPSSVSDLSALIVPAAGSSSRWMDDGQRGAGDEFGKAHLAG